MSSTRDATLAVGSSGFEENRTRSLKHTLGTLSQLSVVAGAEMAQIGAFRIR